MTINHRPTDYGVEEKQCTKCLDWWPADGEFFSRNVTAPDGLAYHCKCCQAEYKREKYGYQRRRIMTPLGLSV